MVERRPNKKKLYLENIDSAYISSMYQKKSLKLTEEKLSKFISVWNSANESAFNPKSDPVFNSVFQAKLFVYEKNAQKREFSILLSKIGEKGDWTYKTKNDERIFEKGRLLP